ncbi:MAG: type II secretion system protein [Planctomycetota bacterium]|nr:type II secretion system protein [Planctomycetota bacterium]MDA1248793.1 type II secretion system protein [Planctomycetota bacterium]
MRRHRHISERPRSGFTLIEVLLVVAIMMTMVGLAWTPLLRSWGDHRLKAATEDVRSTLAGTRIQALENDATWQFRYEPGGNHFVRVPYQTAETEGTSVVFGRMSLILPAGMTFSENNSAGIARSEPLTALDVQGLADAGELTGLPWSQPILFYSDGTATEVMFQVIDDQAGEMTVSVRDLTGAVSVKQESADEEL